MADQTRPAGTTNSPPMNSDSQTLPPPRPATTAAASPPSRFTAVNGRELPAPNATAAPSAETSDSRPSLPPPPPSHPDRPYAESWSQQQQQQQRQSINGESNELAPLKPQTQDLRRSSSPHSTSTKRKRSDSSDIVRRGDSVGMQRSPDNMQTDGESRNGSEFDGQRQSMSHQASPQMMTGGQGGYTAVSSEQQSRPATYQQSRPYEEPREYGAQTPDRPTQGYRSDAEIAQALQRGSQSLDAGQSERAGSMDDDASHGSAPRNTDYGTDRTPSGLQLDSKRRKRVFSNRTKTGCLTCRRRKKKCDELKPECNNCIRGGFVCEGYSSRVEWPKSSNTAKPPLLLQAKDGELLPVASDDSPQHHHHTLPNGMSAQAQQPVEAEKSVFRHHQPPPQQTMPAAPPPPPLRPAEEERRPPSPDLSRPPPGHWSKPSWHTHPEYHQADSYSEPSRPQAPRDSRKERHTPVTTPQSALSHRSMTHPSHSRSPQTAQQQQQAHSRAQVQAQMALQHSAAQAPSTEKEKMLSGQLYFASDPMLVSERERCKAACWRFNNSTNPNHGVSPEERARLFRKIVQPDEPAGSRTNSPAAGYVGENVLVEAPLTCDYGYNLSIGEDVSIGANCTMLDTCTISIGKRCILGPNVSLYTATLPVDPRHRKGSQGPSMGKGITIEDDCWIGGGVTILPGIKIGRSSTVGAGSVVTRNVPEYTVFCGNPAVCIRGIYARD